MQLCIAVMFFCSIAAAVVNLDKILATSMSHSGKSCYINLISGINLDWDLPPRIPITTTTPKHEFTANETLCGPNRAKNASGDFWNSFCPRIRQILLQRSVTCVTVIEIGVISTKQIQNIYWYLQQYWTAPILVPFTSREKTSPAKKLEYHPGKASYILSYIQIFAITLLAEAAQKVVKDWRKYSFPSYRPWKIFELLPVVVVNLQSDKYSLLLPKRNVINLSSMDARNVDSAFKRYIQANNRLRIQAAPPIFNENSFVVPFNYTLQLRNYLRQRRNISSNSRDPIMHFLITGWMQNEEYRDPNSIYVPVGLSSYSLVTCSGREQRGILSGARNLILPFDGMTWASLLISALVLYIFMGGIFKIQNSQDSASLLLFSALLEQSVIVTKIWQNKQATFSTLFMVFILVAITITNAYKGILIRDLVLPADSSRLNSVQEAIPLNYSLFYQLHGISASRHSACCASSEGLSKKAHYIQGATETDNITCGMETFLYSRILSYLVQNIDGSLDEFAWSKLGKVVRQKLPNPNAVGNSPSQTNLRHLLRLASESPPPCSRTVHAELLKCNHSMFIDTTPEIQKILFRAKYTTAYKNVYELPSLPEQNMFKPSLMYGLKVSAKWDKKELSLSTLNFIESGNFIRAERMGFQSNAWKLITEIRQSGGNIVDSSIIPIALDLSTNIRIIFIILLICALCSVVTFLAEIEIGLINYRRLTLCYT